MANANANATAHASKPHAALLPTRESGRRSKKSSRANSPDEEDELAPSPELAPQYPTQMHSSPYGQPMGYPYPYPPAYPPPGYPAYPPPPPHYPVHASPYGQPTGAGYYSQQPPAGYHYGPPNPPPRSTQPQPLNALAAAAASGLHEMERERELKEKASGERSHPASASTTPYGSFDPPHHGAGYWPSQTPVSTPASSFSPPEDLSKHLSTTSNSRSSNRRPPHSSHHHPHLSHPSLLSADDPSTRHSHSHDPSNPAHHTSLSRTQHRHAYNPYGYGSTDHSLANSPASSVAGSDSEGEEGTERERGGSKTSRRGVGSGLRGTMPHHPTAPGAHDRLGQLHQALQFGFQHSTSPVLGPLKGLTIKSAAASRVGSRVHSRASSPVLHQAAPPPIHLPPLKLPPNLQHVANGVGLSRGGDVLSGGSGSGSANTSGATSGAASPETMSLLNAKAGGTSHELSTHHHQLASLRLHRSHPYSHNATPTPPNGRSQPGSPTAHEFAAGLSRGTDGGLSPPNGRRTNYASSNGPGPTAIHTPSSFFFQNGQSSNAGQPEKLHTIRDILNGTIGGGADHARERTLPPLSSLPGSYARSSNTSTSAYFPQSSSAPGSRHNSPPSSPRAASQFSSGNVSSARGSDDSLASLIYAASVQAQGGGSGVGGMGMTFSRRGFGKSSALGMSSIQQSESPLPPNQSTPLVNQLAATAFPPAKGFDTAKFASPTLGGEGLQLAPLNYPKVEAASSKGTVTKVLVEGNSRSPSVEIDVKMEDDSTNAMEL